MVIPPLFITEFILDTTQLLFQPDEDVYLDGMAEVIKGFQDTVLRVQNLVPDPYFDAFTRQVDIQSDNQMIDVQTRNWKCCLIN